MADLKDTTINGSLTTGTAEINDAITLNGTDLETKFSLIDTINTRLNKIYGSSYSLTSSTTCTLGSNYTSYSDLYVHLIGNYLRIVCLVKRSSATSGNISNEDMITLKVNSGGKISGYWGTSFTNSLTGGNASLQIVNNTISNGVLTFSVRLCSIAQSSTSITFNTILPVRINPSAY